MQTGSQPADGPGKDPSASTGGSARLEHLAAVIETSSDAILSKTLDGTIMSWNASAERIFGYTAKEMIGQSIRRLIPEELQGEEDEILAKLRSGRYIEHYETVRLTKTGRRLDVSLSISPVKNASGRVVGAAKIARDITPRKQAEAALAAATAKFESVFNQSGIFAGILDVDGNLLEVNVLAVEGCGYSREEVLGRPFWQTPWWRGAAQVQERIQMATQRAGSGEVFRERLPYWLADGSERIVDFALHPIRNDTGAVIFLHPTGVDVTERARAEEALQAKEAEEREIALGLQRALLPTGLPDHGQLAFAARYEAGSDALEVGGDWYDAFQLPNGCVGLTVGDVVGHGLAAAASMGQVRTALAALAEHASGPGELLCWLDAFLSRSGATDFATVSYAVLDPVAGTLTYACAGHPPMLMVSPAGETTWLWDGRSGPLCGDGGSSRPQATATLEPGATLILYSDGLIERRGERLDFGLDRLEAAAAALAHLSADDVCDRLVADLGVASSRQDDVAVLVVRLTTAAHPAYRHEFPARPEELRAIRASLRTWLDQRGITDERTRHALLLAVGEACGNAAEHAYSAAEEGVVTVEITDEAPDLLLVEIRDRGRFRVSGPRADRGRGTDIMRGLTADFARESSATGTTVRFRLPLEQAAVA